MNSATVIFLLLSLVTADRTYVDYIQICDDASLGMLSNIKVWRSKDSAKQLYGANLAIKHKINLRGAKVAVNLEKCTSRNVSSCSSYPPITLPSPCNMRNIPQLPIKDLFDCIDPPVDCTFEQGKYKLKNCLVDLSDFKLIALGNYYWKTQITVYGRNEKYLCYKAMVYLA